MPQAEKFVSEGIEAKGFELWFRKRSAGAGLFEAGLCVRTFTSEALEPEGLVPRSRKALQQEWFVAGTVCGEDGPAARKGLRRGNVSYQGIALAMPKQISVLSAFRRCLEVNAIADTRARVN
jgi:hypothetical protein